MPLLQPFVTPGLVLLGAGIGAVVTSPPAVPEVRDVAPTTVQKQRADVAVATEIPTSTGPASAVVPGVSDAAGAVSVPVVMVPLVPSSIDAAAQVP